MPFTTLFNGQLCKNGEVVEEPIVVSSETGRIVNRDTGGSFIGGDAVDLEERIVAPGYLELQTNGMNGFHFSNFSGEEEYQSGLKGVSRFLVKKGVTGFWATLPTVAEEQYHKILPALSYQDFSSTASLLGAHVEGPFLAPSRRGAHSAELFKLPNESDFRSLYGLDNLRSNVKLATIAPELEGAGPVISQLSSEFNVKVSMGHSEATFEHGLQGLQHGASALTHVFNAMNPIHHRSPGLAGLIANRGETPYFTLIPDGIHLHPATLNLAYRANPDKCILITDSIEPAGLPDGVYPGNSQIRADQVKKGDRVVITGTETLIGSCLTLDEGVRNLINWSGCSVAHAVKCVTENVADLMGLNDRGRLTEGHRADFVILDEEATICETWVKGVKVWDANA